MIKDRISTSPLTVKGQINELGHRSEDVISMGHTS